MEKTGKVLAWQIKSRQKERAIAYIANTDGSSIVDPRQINKSFRSYYMQLHSSECLQGSNVQKKNYLR